MESLGSVWAVEVINYLHSPLVNPVKYHLITTIGLLHPRTDKARAEGAFSTRAESGLLWQCLSTGKSCTEEGRAESKRERKRKGEIVCPGESQLESSVGYEQH